MSATSSGPHDLEEIVEVLPRNLLRRGQTPQAFRLSVIRKAYENASSDDNFEATDDCSVVLKYTPDVPIGVVPGEEKNMKVTEPIDVFMADKLFQLGSHDRPDPRTSDEYRATRRQDSGDLRGSYGIGSDIADLAADYGATVKSFSRSGTNTHVERREDIRAACRDVIADTGRVDFVVNTMQTSCPAESSLRQAKTIYYATGVNYLAPIFIAQEFYPYLAMTSGSFLMFTSSSYTRGRSVGNLPPVQRQGSSTSPRRSPMVGWFRCSSELHQPGTHWNADATNAFRVEPPARCLSLRPLRGYRSMCCSRIKPATLLTFAGLIRWLLVHWQTHHRSDPDDFAAGSPTA